MFDGKAKSTPRALWEFIRKRAPHAKCIGFETGVMASWLWRELRRVGLPVRLYRRASRARRAFGSHQQEQQESDITGKISSGR
jgi:transposase